MKHATALYGRTSKDDPKKVTIEIQQTTLRKWATTDGLVEKVVDEYWDDGVTGKLPLGERPEGRRLLEDVRSGRVKSVAVVYADRFGRTLLDGLQAVKILEDSGCKLVAINDGWDARRDDNPMYFQFRMMLAEEEHRRISERMKNGKLRAMDRDNAPPGGCLVFGYRMSQDGQFEPDPVEAAIVVRVFQMAIEGHSNAEILAWAASTGVAAGRRFQKRLPGSPQTIDSRHASCRWHSTKISKILRNRVYIGERKWKDRIFPCVPLVDMTTFLKAQQINEARSRVQGDRNRHPTALFSGVFKCSCGGRFYLKRVDHYRKKEPGRRTGCYWIYMCDKASRNWGTSCKSKMVPVVEFDRVVWELVQKRISNPTELIQTLSTSSQKLDDEAVRLDTEEAGLVAELERLTAQAAEVWREQEANDWSMEFVKPKLDRLTANQKKAKAKLEQVRSRRSSIKMSQDEMRESSLLLASYQKDVTDATVEQKRDYIRMLAVRDECCIRTIKTVAAGRTRKEVEVDLVLRWYGSLHNTVGLNTDGGADCGSAAFVGKIESAGMVTNVLLRPESAPPT